jgi:thioredoxin reductase
MNDQQVLDYVIVGAGPAGLQMAYCLQQAKRRFVVLETGRHAGRFFEQQPRHRTLLSINKIHNLYPEREFNLRHDWNSLLTDDDSLQFRNYSRALFPSADDLVRYLRDFAERGNFPIEYECRVDSISRSGNGFTVACTSGRRFECHRLLMATGTVAEMPPLDLDGIEHTTSYATHELDPGIYENKRVAIVGRGNSAFEVANHLAGSAAVIHIMVGDRPPRHAWQTHFVGDLRAINNTIIDMYQLKSLHAMLGFRVLKVEKKPDGVLSVLLEEDVADWKRPTTYRVTMDYDHVILCTGWRYYEPALFHHDCRPEADSRAKYPVLSSAWESSVPGIYYVGAPTAGRDRRAASGFIHGFRYNVRSLFHILEERHFGVPLPSSSFDLRRHSALEDLATHLLQRMSTSSGLYQVNGFLCDAIHADEHEARYFPELPLDFVREREPWRESGRLFTLTLEYGFDKYPEAAAAIDFIHPSDPTNPGCAALLHPVIRCFEAGIEVEEFHLGESLIVRYDRHFSSDSFCKDFSSRFRSMNLARIKNLFNRHLRLTDTHFDESLMESEGAAGSGFVPWSDERIRQHREQLTSTRLARTRTPCSPSNGGV